MNHSDLVGEWSIEVGYYSSMEDEMVIFWPDGAGAIEYARPGFSDWILFRWAHTGPGRVRLSQYSAFDEEDDEIVAIYEPPAEIEATYRVAPEFRPLPATDVPVLHLDAPGLLVSSLGFGLQSAVPREIFRREPPSMPAPRPQPG